MSFRRLPREQGGFTLVEVAASLLLVSLAALTLHSLLFQSASHSQTGKNRLEMAHLAKTILERCRTESRNSLTPSGACSPAVPSSVIADSLPTGSAPADFQVSVRIKEDAALQTADPAASTHIRLIRVEVRRGSQVLAMDSSILGR